MRLSHKCEIDDKKEIEYHGSKIRNTLSFLLFGFELRVMHFDRIAPVDDSLAEPITA